MLCSQRSVSWPPSLQLQTKTPPFTTSRHVWSPLLNSTHSSQSICPANRLHDGLTHYVYQLSISSTECMLLAAGRFLTHITKRLAHGRDFISCCRIDEPAWALESNKPRLKSPLWLDTPWLCFSHSLPLNLSLHSCKMRIVLSATQVV